MRRKAADSQDKRPELESGTKKLVKDSGWMLVSHGGRLALQAAYFVILAHVLGPAEYGEFVGTVALISFLAPLVALGTGHILVRNVSRDSNALPTALADSLLVCAFGGLIALPIGLAIIALGTSMEQPLWVLLLLLLSDVIGTQLTELAGQCYQATRRIKTAAAIFVAPVAARMAAITVVSMLPGEPNLKAWLVAYTIAGIVTALVAIRAIWASTTLSRPSSRRALSMASDGWHFSVIASAQAAHADADKALMSRLAPHAAAGTYAAAYRLTDVAFAPVRSLMYTAYSQFYVAGSSSESEPRKLGLRVLRVTGSYSLLACAAIWLVAPLAPIALGASFDGTVDALRWLALLLPLRAASAAGADALAGAGAYSARTRLTIAAALTNICLNVLLIPRYSWLGAVCASLASEAFLAIAIWTRLSRQRPMPSQ